MDSKLLKAGADVHHAAIQGLPANGVCSEAQLTAINAAIGRLIASVPESMTMDVYNALLEFTQVVKAHPITPSTPASTVSGAASIDAASSKLSAAAYPFIKDVDWTSNLFSKPIPGQSPQAVLKAVDKMIVMGAAMNAGLGKAVASVPTSKVMDVYNAMAKVIGDSPVPNYLYSTVNPNDAQAAYNAFLEFKDVVKAAQRRVVGSAWRSREILSVQL